MNSDYLQTGNQQLNVPVDMVNSQISGFRPEIIGFFVELPKVANHVVSMIGLNGFTDLQDRC